MVWTDERATHVTKILWSRRLSRSKPLIYIEMLTTPTHTLLTFIIALVLLNNIKSPILGASNPLGL